MVSYMNSKEDRKNNAVYSDSSDKKYSEIKFNKKFLEAIYKKLTGLAGRTPIHLMAVPGRMKNRLDLCDLSIANVEPDLDLFSGKAVPKTDGYAKKFLETLLTKDKFDFKFSWEDKKITSMDSEAKDALTIVGKRLNSMLIDNEDVFIDTGLKNFGFGYPLLVLPDPKDKDKAVIAPIFIWSLDICHSNRKNEWIISKTEDSPIKMNEILVSYIENTMKLKLLRLEAEDLDDGILQADEIQKYLKDLIKKLNIKHDDLNLRLEPVGTKERLVKLCSENGFIQWSGVFGLYRSQKETIIESVLELENNIDSFNEQQLELKPFSTSSEASFETDPSQSEIIRTLNDNEFKIIQGPPGTGKSQAISAIISNALANKAKTLVVCEKKTALEVLKRNLEEKGLDTFCIVVDDVNKDRKAVVNKARGLQEYNPNKAFNAAAFERDQQEFLTLRAKINECYGNSSEKVLGDYTWTDVIGLYLKYSKLPTFDKVKEGLKEFAESKFDFDMQEFVEFCSLVKVGHERYSICKHIDQKAFDLLDINALKDVSISYNIETQDNISLVRKRINDVSAFLKNNYCELGKATINTTEKTLNDYIKVFESYVEQIEKAKNLENLNTDYKSKVHFFQAVNDLDIEFSKTAKSLNIPYDKVNFVVSEVEKSIKDTEKLDKTTERFVADAQKLHGIEINLQSDSASVKEFVGIAKELSCSINNTTKKLAGDYVPLKFDDKIAEKLEHLSIIMANTQSIKGNCDSGKEVLGEEFSEYKGGLFSRLLSKKAAEAFKYYKNIELKYKEIGKTLKNFAKAYNDDIDSEGAFNDEVHTPGEMIKIVENVSEKASIRQSKLCAELVALLVDIDKSVSGLQEEIWASNAEINELINSICEKISVYQNSCHVNIKTLKAILQCQSHIADTDELLLSKFPGLKSKDLKYDTVENYIVRLKSMLEKIDALENQLEDLEQYMTWMDVFKPGKQLFEVLMLEEDDYLWEDLFKGAYYYYFLLNYASKNKKRFLTSTKENYLQILRDLFLKLQNNNTKKIFNIWHDIRENAIYNLDSAFGFKALFALKRGKYAKKLSLRQIIERDFDSFTDLFPVVMVNPIVANALLPLQQGLFNLVIFDEASQLRIEDVYTSMIRGQYKIIAGDKHQMPPSNWFAKNADNSNLDDEEDDDLTLASTDVESLLEYAEHFKNAKQFASHLDFHYRSKHPALIEFSNCAFYGSNLCPLPNRLAETTPFEYHYIAGAYVDRMNKDEAFKVVEIIRNLPRDSKGKLPSVGIATFNVQQRNLIKNLLHEIEIEDEDFAKICTELNQNKDPLFVKNLENIQGDERDIIIISTTYGPGADNKFREQFVINRQEGYRLLNVLITRAKQRLIVLTSIPESKFLDYKARLDEAQENNKTGIFYAYLAYVRAHANHEFDVAKAVLKDISKYSYEEPRRDLDETAYGLTESPFEEEVYEELVSLLPKESIHPQYKVGGYRLDFLLTVGDKRIALECDGKAYHQSEEAFVEDMQRQKILEGYGYIFYRIWSTSWFTNKEKEVLKLKRFLEQL